MKALPIALAILLAFFIVYLPHLLTTTLNEQTSNQTIPGNSGMNFSITHISQDNAYIIVPLTMLMLGFSAALLVYLILKRH